MDVVKTSIEALNGIEVKVSWEGIQVYSKVAADPGDYQNING